MKITLLITGCLFFLMSCGKPQEQRGGDYPSLQICMAILKAASGGPLKVNIDEPNNVVGYTIDGETWWCTLRQSGTKGFYWEGGYFVKEKK